MNCEQSIRLANTLSRKDLKKYHTDEYEKHLTECKFCAAFIKFCTSTSAKNVVSDAINIMKLYNGGKDYLELESEFSCGILDLLEKKANCSGTSNNSTITRNLTVRFNGEQYELLDNLKTILKESSRSSTIKKSMLSAMKYHQLLNHLEQFKNSEGLVQVKCPKSGEFVNLFLT